MIKINLEQRSYILWHKEKKTLETFFEALKKAREATAVNI